MTIISYTINEGEIIMSDRMIIIGKNLKTLREQNGYTQKSIASLLNVDQSLISKFETGERKMSVDMLERLAVLFGIPEASFSDVDLEVKKVSRSFRANNIDDDDIDVIYSISKIFENLKYMDGLLSPYEEEENELRVLNEKIKVNMKMDERSKAEVLRRELGEDNNSPIDIFSIINSLDYTTTVFYPMGDSLSGLCMKDEKNIVIGINSNMSIGRQRFSMAHELFHAYCEKEIAKSISFRIIGNGNNIEKKADKFASYFLIPYLSLFKELNNRMKEKLSLENVVELEQFYGVSRKAILYRLLIDNIITNEEYDRMSNNVIASAKMYGYDDVLYRPLPKEKQYMTLGKYIRQVNKLYDKNIISKGKYEEFLLEAFRTDIVYGEDVEGSEKFD